MPRRGQGVKVAPNQPYGMGVEQARAQQAIPLAQQPPMPQAQPAAAPTGGPPMPHAGPGLFSQPDDRPTLPVTAGLDVGPGPGSSALMLNADSPRQFWQTLAMVTGDPRYADLAARLGV